MSHRHFCDYAGHYWVCDGMALRPHAGDPEPSPCECNCELPLEGFDHSECPVELVVCPAHVEAQQRQIEEIHREVETRNAEFGLNEKFARMQAMPDGPEKDAAAWEIVTFLFGIPEGTPKDGEAAHCQCGCAIADPATVVAWCLQCDHVYVEYSSEIQDQHFAHHCPSRRKH
jgi:hypothetical protein